MPIGGENVRDVGTIELSEQAVVNHVLLENEQATDLGGNLFRKQLLKIGEWVHPNDPSRKLTITRDLIRKLVENFRRGVLDKVPVPDTHTRSALANTGYVVGLEEAEDGLYGILKIEDETALEKLKRGLIPGISVSFTENYTVKETGEKVGPVLIHAALVDNPYIKGMRDFEPVALGDDEDSEHVPYVEGKEDDKMELDQLLTALKEEHKIDVTALQDQVKELEQARKDLATATETLDKIQQAVGEKIELSDDMGVVDAVKQLVSEVERAEKETTELADRVAKLEEEGRKRDAKEAVGELVREGKVALADVEHYEKLYLSDKGLFESITKTLKPVVDLSERGVTDTEEPGSGDSFDAEAEIKRITKEYGISR